MRMACRGKRQDGLIQEHNEKGLERKKARRTYTGTQSKGLAEETGKTDLNRNTMRRAWRGKTIKRACR